MRLSALGTAAVGLMVVVVLTAGSLVISFTLAMPAMGRMARPFALEQVAAIDTSVGALEQALAKEDWEAMQEHADQASSALHRLAHGPAITSLTSWNEPPTVEELRAQVRAAHEQLRAAQQAMPRRMRGGVRRGAGRVSQIVWARARCVKKAGTVTGGCVSSLVPKFPGNEGTLALLPPLD